MDDTLRGILAKKAYETYSEVNGAEHDYYFKREYRTWDELPESTRLRWKNVIFSVIKELDNMNYKT
jgi:hypothetical protein